MFRWMVLFGTTPLMCLLLATLVSSLSGYEYGDFSIFWVLQGFCVLGIYLVWVKRNETLYDSIVYSNKETVV